VDLDKTELQRTIRSFTLLEKVIFCFFAGLFLISGLFLAWKVNASFMVEVPASGGTLTEGVLGYPRYINPLLPITDAGKDMTALIYSGLMKVNPQGDLVPDLAQDYTISPDGLTYTFHLKDNIYFQDGTPITADDVQFTVEKALDPDLKSPVMANWTGVAVKAVNAKEIQFILKKPYGPFLQNTTLGILPKHLWQNINDTEFNFSNYNVEPIGSGPYKIKSIKRDSQGLPEYYQLVPFSGHVGGEASISNIIIRFYNSQDDLIKAYRQGAISSINSISPSDAEILKSQGAQVETAPLPRVFGVFFNQNSAAVLTNKEVRQALNTAVDRQVIVQQVLNGYGTAIDGPLPANSISGESGLRASSTISSADRVATAKKILTDQGWALNSQGVMQKKTTKGTQTLAFSISTANTPDLTTTASIIKAEWQAIGAQVTVNIFDVGDLNQNVIRTRKYDSLLFGEVIGRDLDLYAFWDSAERNNPGLNIALYANSKTDALLEDARATSTESTRLDDYAKFEDEIYADTPAVFLYSPDFIYIIPKGLKGFALGAITLPSERFLTVSSWYLDTDNVWKIFTN
jgi:peptide/nickel transport system substrate-binding protein